MKTPLHESCVLRLANALIFGASEWSKFKSFIPTITLLCPVEATHTGQSARQSQAFILKALMIC